MKPRRTPLRSRSPWTIRIGAIGLAVLVAGVGCGNKDDEDEEAAAEACAAAEEHLEQSAWPTVLGTNCANCHTPGGPAVTQGSDFVLLPPGYPNFQQANLEAFKQAAAYEVDDVSVVLLKPQGQLNHGGGKVLEKNGDEYDALKKLVELVGETNSCGVSNEGPDHEDVELLDARSSLRKAALHLAYRLPTASENEKAGEDGEDALPALIEGLMEEEAFYERLRDIFNNKLLAERYLAYIGYAVNLLDETMYPESGEPWDALEDEDLRRTINRGIALEPLDFITYLVRNNKPFTDVVAGNYMVVTPITARYFNHDPAKVFDDPSDPNQFAEVPRVGNVEVARDVFEMGVIPGAGVMTSPAFLNRFPTTDTNRNRHRARMVLDIFLGTDILKVGERPLDPTEAGLYPNPTQNDPSCASCHEIIDPIAGAFQKFEDGDQEEYNPSRSWYGEMRAAGFKDEQMPTYEIPNAPTWLGERIAKDPRFPYAMVKIIYEGMMGRAPEEHPSDFSAEDYGARFRAWRDQETLFQTIGQKFVDAEYNLRTIVRELALSPFFRAKGIDGDPGETRGLEVSGLGTGRLSTPMLLARKIEAVTGIPWTRNYDSNDNLLTDYRILYGGIDSDTVNQRLTVPNGVMAGVAWRMANELACTVTSWEFYLGADDRKLLPFVSQEDTPLDESGAANDAAVASIKKNIVYLYERILGKSVETDSPEVDMAYELFEETWKEGQELIVDETNDIGSWMSGRCRAETNLNTGEAIPDEERIRQDPLYTIRAWRAVITFLLSDYEFLYE